MPTLCYTTPFQYGAQVRNQQDYKIHEYLDEQKLSLFASPFETPYPKIDIDLKYFKILCEDAEDVNKGDINGQTALHALCLYGSMNALKILLEAGADLGSEDLAGFSVAHYCAMSDRADLLAYLDRAGVSITKQALSTSRTPLHVASICNSVKSVKYLLESGVNCNQVDNYGYSPLWLALYYRNDQICQLLSQHGAQTNLNEVDKVCFIFRTVEKCTEFGQSLLNSLLTNCQYRGVSCVWLNNLVNGVSYQSTDLSHSFLYLTTPDREFIQHPVIRCYTRAAWHFFGRKSALINFLTHLIFSVLFTLHFMTDNGKTFRDKGNVGRIIAFSLLLPYAGFMVYDLVMRMKRIYFKQLDCLEFERGLVDKELDNLHPCMWNAYHVLLREKRGITQKLVNLRVGKVLAQKIFELLVVALTVLMLILDLVMTAASKDEDRRKDLNIVYIIISSSVMVLIWLQTFYKLRYFKEFGAFLVSINKLAGLLLKFAVMFVFFYIPIACVFWKTIYESTDRNGTDPHPDLSAPLSTTDNSTRVTFPDAFYKVYRMTFSDYTYSDGLKIAAKQGLPSWWNVLTFYWLTVGGLILLKILGGMVFVVLSEPLKESLLTAYRERLHYICEVVMNQSNSARQDFARHLEMECKPYVHQGELVREVRSQEQERERELERINHRLDNLTENLFRNERSVSSSSGMNNI